MDEAHNKLLERLRTYYGDDLACRTLLMDARHALEALAGEVELVRAERHRAQTACEQIAVRLHAAEAERDRLKAENDLFYAFCNAAWSVGGLDVDWIQLAFINPLRVYKARKALGDVS